ncbi:MAG: hypothetical protein QOI62_1482 [Solirubrobacteraceae bacterium]|nr:hypothetical protein [Solirubrobacteraceae bacterium]
MLWSDYQAISAWLHASGSPLGVEDLVRVLEAVRGRLAVDPLPAGHDVLLDAVDVTPNYVPSELGADLRGLFVEHLGLVGYRRLVDRLPAGVVTATSSWTGAGEIAVEAEIQMRSTPNEPDHEPRGDDRFLRELLFAWVAPKELFELLAEYPCSLMGHLAVGVRAIWQGGMGEDPRELSFRLGPRLGSSIDAMNYSREPRRAKACLRTMAMIAGGRQADVPGHRERAGAGGNNRVITDNTGRTLHRSYLAQSSPNAHRLFWWDGPEPEFINVGGHDAAPMI